MRFTIISAHHDNSLPQTEYDFCAPGGTIGRGHDNNLVLPDSERSISRLQAIVHVTPEGECRLTNRGNVTRVVLNNIVLERGHQIALQDGDILEIGEYRIRVGSASAATVQNSGTTAQVPPTAMPRQLTPATDATNDLFDGLDTEPLSPTGTATPAPAVPSPSAPPLVAASADVSDEIWNDLLQEFTPQPTSAAPVEANIDPFDVPAAPDRNPENPLEHLALHDDLLTPGNIATDKLFIEESLFKQETIFSNTTPTALTSAKDNVDPLQQLAPQTQDALDPLALFGATTGPAASDDPLALLTDQAAPLASVTEPTPAFVAPVQTTSAREPLTDFTAHDAAPDMAQASPSTEPEPNEPVPVTLPQSLQSCAGFGEITLPTPQAVATSSPSTAKGRLRIDPVQTPDGIRHGDATDGGETLGNDMLEALLEGMGLSDVQPQPQFDRESMRQLGQLLGMFAQGTVALLSSRSILKRGVKADMTMVLEDANNPFKLLPSGKTVLMQMFGTRMPGFMSPTKSVRDALIDLQAHQLGMIAGIRAIIAAMLQSFNPEQLEAQAKQHGSVSRLSLLHNRKADLWDYFTRHYAQTAGEIEDDFHTLFGEAFLHAYDMEVNQYKDSQSGGEKP